MVNSFSGAVPTCVISIARISARVDLRLFYPLDALVFQALLNFEKLLSSRLIGRMPSRANSVIPSGTFRSKEVTIDGVLDICDRLFRSLVTRVSVLVPPVEASLISSVIQLTVMN